MCARALRSPQCPQEEVDRVLDYPGFVDLVTVVHEHVLGLRPWHQRSATCQPGERDEIRAEAVGAAAAAAAVSAPAATQPSVEDGVDVASSEVKIEKLNLSSKDVPPSSRTPDEATPWLGWDFAALFSNDTAVTREAERCCSSTASVSFASAGAIPASGGKPFHDGQDAKAEPKGDDNNDRGGYRRKELEGEDEKKAALAEEPKMNRPYGGGPGGDDLGASVNKLFAFQMDRVVRTLEDIF